MKIKSNEILLLAGFTLAGYFIFRKNAGIPLSNNGCTPGALYYNSAYDLYTDFCPSEYPGQRWYQLNDLKLYPEQILPDLGYLQIGQYWVHENVYDTVVEGWQIEKQQNALLTLTQYASTLIDGLALLGPAAPTGATTGSTTGT